MAPNQVAARPAQAERPPLNRRSMERRQTTVLRVACWLCAIFELMAVVPMLSPALFGGVMGIRDFHPGPDYVYAMGIAAAFTLGWIGLLIWADRRPLERRGVMALTIFPVFAGNLLCGVYAAVSGFIDPAKMIPSLIAQALLIGLFAIGLYEARKLRA